MLNLDLLEKKMKTKYPTLHEMGIENSEDIERYSLQTTNNIDILRIVYKRKKGSLLPTSKKFRFGRSKKMIVTDSGSNSTEIIHEVSPFVVKATDELNQLINTHHSIHEQKEIILEEITRLEEETNTRISYLKSLVEKLD
jgi:hypothetical protein